MAEDKCASSKCLNLYINREKERFKALKKMVTLRGMVKKYVGDR